MADDKKLKLELQATGGTAAAKEVEKVETSVEDLAKQASETRAIINNLAEALDRAAEESTPAAKELKEVAAQLDVVEEKAHAAAAAQKQLTQGSAPLAKGQGNAAFAFLEFSRAIEDAQYGVRGVINNIPTLVSYMGAGAGVAGVASLAAVALAQLLPLLMDTGETAKKEAEKLAAAQDFAAEAVEGLNKQIEAQRKARADLEAGNVLDLGKAAVARWEQEEAALGRVVAQYRAYQAVKLEEISAAAAIETARVNADEESGKMSAIEAVQARAAITDRAEAEALTQRQKAAEMELAVSAQRVKNANAQLTDLQRSETNAARQAAAAGGALTSGLNAGPAFEAAQKNLEAATNARRLAQGSVASLAGSSFGHDTPAADQVRAQLTAAMETEKQAKAALDEAQKRVESTDLKALENADAAARKAAESARERREEAEATARALEAEVIAEEKLIRLRQQADAAGVSNRALVRGIQTGSTVEQEQARLAREQQAAELKRQQDELAAQQRAAAPGFADRADRVQAAGLGNAAGLIESTAADLANGIGLSGIEARMFQAAQMIQGVPEAQRALIEAALAPVTRALEQYKARIEQMEAQLRNNSNRG